MRQAGAQHNVSVSSCGSTYCWGHRCTRAAGYGCCSFSILVRIDLLLGGLLAQRDATGAQVSVSSCGSTYCWGGGANDSPQCCVRFQYPRADRLIVGGADPAALRSQPRCFSILVRIDLLLGELPRFQELRILRRFSILVRIDLLLGIWTLSV